MPGRVRSGRVGCGWRCWCDQRAGSHSQPFPHLCSVPGAVSLIPFAPYHGPTIQEGPPCSFLRELRRPIQATDSNVDEPTWNQAAWLVRGTQVHAGAPGCPRPLTLLPLCPSSASET